MAAPDRVVLIDGSALIFRAFFAIPQKFATSAGQPTNAVYGFALMFRKLLAGKQPRFGAMIFDHPSPTFRDRSYPQYKAQRPEMPGELRSQIALIHEVVEAHDYPMISVPGVEADDVIGTLTKQALAAGHEVHIISGDKDFAQLVGPRVRMIDTMRDITYDEELVRKKWGVTPAQFVDYLAMVGDKADNIPGIPGIGAKGAAKLLAEHGSLDGAIAVAPTLKGRARTGLTEHVELGRLSRTLATIRCDVQLPRPLDSLTLTRPPQTRINELYKRLEFYSLLGAEAADDGATDDGDFEAVADLDGLRGYLNTLPPDRTVGLWPVWEPPLLMRSPLVGLALGTATDGALQGRYVPLTGPHAVAGARDLLAPWLEQRAELRVFDQRDLLALLRASGLPLGEQTAIRDAQLASFLIDPTRIIPHRLDQVVRAFLHRVMPPASGVIGSGKKQIAFADADPAAVAGWAGHIAATLDELWPPVAERLEKEGQTACYRDVALPMASVLADMQRDGITVDGDVLAQLGAEFSTRRAEVEAAIHKAAGRSFKIGSPKQLGGVLFDELGLPVIKRTKSGYSTAADVLERLAPKHPIAADVIRWRALDKLINTYTRVLREAIDPATGRVHCTYNQTAGASGRLITTDPDLQRTPIRTGDGVRIRQAFLARPGWRLISADWSQIELRLMAHFSGDEGLREAFQQELDLHARTAARIHEITEAEVTREQRNIGKMVNFATLYGQGATALGQQLGIPRSQAKKMQERYFAAYPKVRLWLDQTVEQAHEQGFVTTILGRRRYIPELSAGNFSQRSYGERIATNTPIQGSAADICKLAMLAIASDLKAAGLQARMLLQIHDELLFEAPPEEVEQVTALVRARMRQPPLAGTETPIELGVPLRVDIGVGASWAEAH